VGTRFYFISLHTNESSNLCLSLCHVHTLRYNVFYEGLSGLCVCLKQLRNRSRFVISNLYHMFPCNRLETFSDGIIVCCFTETFHNAVRKSGKGILARLSTFIRNSGSFNSNIGDYCTIVISYFCVVSIIVVYCYFSFRS